MRKRRRFVRLTSNNKSNLQDSFFVSFGEFADFSGADDLTNPEFVKDLGTAMMGDFDPDLFPSDDALRQGLDPIDMDGLQMLTDPTVVISDPSAEAHFRLDRL